MTHRRPQLGFDAIAIEGGLLTPGFLVSIADLKAPRQTSADYRVPRGIQVRDEIGRAWRIAEAYWPDVEAAIASGGRVDVAMAAILREAFGWASLASANEPSIIDGRPFPISDFALNGTVPLVLGAPSTDLDKPLVNYGDGQKRRSAFGLVQEYLNATPAALWGVVTNGLLLRVTRDNASLTRPSWIEADLSRIMREDRYADFSVLWLLLHETRFGSPGIPAHECVLEQWRGASAAAGTAARERLRDGVEAALRELGNGFLQHPANGALRSRLQSGSLDPAGYQQELLRLVYRLIFLLVAEERELLHPASSDPAAGDVYRQGYSLNRLRESAARRRAYDRHEDVWACLTVVLRACARGEPRLAIPALGGLFAEDQTPDLDAARITNSFLLAVIYRLSWLEERDTLVRVNWREMGTEELGSVYEALLELVPVVRDDARHFGFVGDALPGEEGVSRPTQGHARKLTGSYYTPDSLVQALLDSTLDPIAQRAESASDPERALLSLAIVDPACGSGHFLLGAARRLASRLARIRSDGTPLPAAYRTALRDVITHCVYGVDKNAMAIELARIALWLEAIDPGRPLAFLDHHLVHGDAILGVVDPALLEHGIPDAAYSPLAGDNKPLAKELKKQNAKARKELERERAAQQFLLSFATDEWARCMAQVDAMPDGSLQEVAAKEAALRAVLASDANGSRFAQDAFVAAFLLRKTAETRASIPTTGTLRNLAAGANPPVAMAEAVEEIARHSPLLHWSVVFAPVMARGGFDCVIGNPPWERLAIEDTQFFESTDPQIAEMTNTARRKRAIEQLESDDPRLYASYARVKDHAERTAAFFQGSGFFTRSARGRLNTYPLFTERAGQVARKNGAVGLVVQSGILFDEPMQAMSEWLTSECGLISFIDFENRHPIFDGVHPSTRFCLLTFRPSTETAEEVLLATGLVDVSDLQDQRRVYSVRRTDLALMSPRTKQPLVSRSGADYELARTIYGNSMVMGATKGRCLARAWVGMTSSSHSQHIRDQVTAGDREFQVVYEGKLIHQYDSRYATFLHCSPEDVASGKPRYGSMADKSDPVVARFVVPHDVAQEFLVSKTGGNAEWLAVYRDYCRTTDERTAIATIIPPRPVLQPLNGWTAKSAAITAMVLGALNSLPLDFVARQRFVGTHLNVTTFSQLPLPKALSASDRFILERVLLLTYTAVDLRAWAEDLEYDGDPFRWDDDRRTVVRAELDAYYAHLFGLTRDELRYTLDPADVMGTDYPSETFRVLKEGELRRYGEYRTRRLVLEAWDRLIGTR